MHRLRCPLNVSGDKREIKRKEMELLNNWLLIIAIGVIYWKRRPINPIK